MGLCKAVENLEAGVTAAKDKRVAELEARVHELEVEVARKDGMLAILMRDGVPSPKPSWARSRPL